MGFSEKLRQKRLEAGFTQKALAEKSGIAVRTVQNYELGSRRPASVESVRALAAALGTTATYLLDVADELVLDAQERGGAKAARDINELVDEVSGLFAGGRLSEESMDGAMRALSEAYWIAKENNRKYGRKKKKAPRG